MNIKHLCALCLALALALTCACAAFAEEVSLKDDFYESVNAQWLAEAEIPSDQPMTGGFTDLSDAIEETLMADFGAMLRGEKEPGDEMLASFIEYYRLAADFETRDAMGAQPLLPYMEQVESLQSLAELSAQWASWDLSGMPAPFSAVVMADMGNASVNALYITMPGLFLSDPSYYADENLKAMLQGAFGQMSANLLVMAGKREDEAAQIVAQALAFDESLVPYARSAEESSDYTSLYNLTDFAAFDAQVSSFDFAAAFTEILGEVPQAIIVTDPDYFAAMDTLVYARQ